jgi:DNA (cytosine-5)-methyltransferase 1
MVMMYPTPTKSDGTGGPGCSGREGGQNLRTAIKMWATPTKRDYKDSPGMASTAINPDGSLRRRNDLLPRQVYQSGETNGSLNPDWVEWLMGFPIGWTSLKPMSQKAMQDWECRVSNGTWWRVDPADSGIISRVAAKVPNSRHRIAAIGNAQVPVCAAVAYSQLRERLVDGS